MTKILVFDVEGSSPKPQSMALFEIGAVVLDMDTGSIEKAFHYVIRNEYKHSEHKSAWIFGNSDLTIGKVLAGDHLEDVREVIQGYFNKYSTLSYNKNYDFTVMKRRKFTFPKNDIWDPQDPMDVATYILKIPKSWGDDPFKWPSVQECLNYFGINETEPHRAFDDCRLEAQIVWELTKLKQYDVPGEEK